MKSQIIPVLIISLIFPWIVAFAFRMEKYHESIHENPAEWVADQKDLLPGIGQKEPTGDPVNDYQLSNKQINYLIP